MPWARLDDGLLGHAKFEGIDDNLLGCWTRGLLYSTRNLTNGRIPQRFAKAKAQLRSAEALIRAGLWHRAKGLQTICSTCWEMVGGVPGDGWVIHDYLEYNPSKDQVQRTRRLNRERQARFRETRHVTPLVTGTEDVTNEHGGARNGLPVLTGPVRAVPEKNAGQDLYAHASEGNGHFTLSPDQKALLQERLRQLQSVPRSQRDRLTGATIGALVRDLGWSEDQARAALTTVAEEMQ